MPGVLDERLAGGGNCLDCLVRRGIADDDVVRAHAGQIPGLVVAREYDVLAHEAVRNLDRLQAVGEALHVHDEQLALAEGGDVTLAGVVVVKNMMVQQVVGQGDVGEDLAVVRGLRIDVDDRDSFLAEGLVRLGLVVEHRQDFGGRRGGEKGGECKRPEQQTLPTNHGRASYSDFIEEGSPFNRNYAATLSLFQIPADSPFPGQPPPPTPWIRQSGKKGSPPPGFSAPSPIRAKIGRDRPARWSVLP